MASYRLPGPVCEFLHAIEIDAGTMCRAPSPAPGPMRKKVKKKRATASKQISRLNPADVEAAAKALGEGIDPRLIQAFAEVESGGKSGFGPAGKPKIAYEGHYFHRLTKGIYDVTHPQLSYPPEGKAGPKWRANNTDQAHRWEVLDAAVQLNEEAALQSCSWGMFQVMGLYYKDCGYPTAKTFSEAMYTDRGQLDAFVGYCKHRGGMVMALRNKDYAKMARLYNGKSYGDYDQRIESAYIRLSAA